jgi:hypothetical protein
VSDVSDQAIEQQIQQLAAGRGRTVLPYEETPTRIVFAPYRSTAAMGQTDVQYDLGDPKFLQFVRDVDLKPIGQVRFPTQQGEFRGMQRFEYKGDLLVDEKNRIARPKYDVRAEPFGVLRELGTNASRRELLDTLYQKGFYSSGKPSTNGFSGADQNAVANLLEYANGMGRTWNVALLEVSSFENERSLSGSVRVSATEDVREYANRDALELLGRTLTRAEFRQVLQQIHAGERAAAGSGQQVASLAALSTQAVQSVAPRELQMNDAADAIDIFREMLAGR